MEIYQQKSISEKSESEPKESYSFLSKDQLDKERQKLIDEFIQISDLSKSQAELVLMNNNWNIDILMNDWFDNTQKYKENSGIAQTKESQEKLNEYFQNHKIPDNHCLICDTDIGQEDYICLECNHKFCSNCFKEYLKEKTKDQLALIPTKCPMQFCNFQVPSEIFLKVLSGENDELNIYNKCLMRNFTESNSDIKLCPNPKCDMIIKVPGHGMIEIKCRCKLSFCFKCLKKGHRPCTCEMMQIWENKNKNNNEKLESFIIKIKQCPNCHKYIEKAQGCNHMTCRKEAGGCGYEFCWICLDKWHGHSSSYVCTRFRPPELDKSNEKENDNNTTDLARYAIFFENYQDEDNAFIYANNLKDKIKEYKNLLVVHKNCLYDETMFLDKALKTVIESHQILKNTYIYGYFITNKDYSSIFRHQQEILRVKVDLLHDKIEMNLLEILKEDNPEAFKKIFNSFKGEVFSLMGAIEKFKENILVDIETHPEFIDYDILK